MPFVARAISILACFGLVYHTFVFRASYYLLPTNTSLPKTTTLEARFAQFCNLSDSLFLFEQYRSSASISCLFIYLFIYFLFIYLLTLLSQVTLGQTRGISDIDAQQMNLLYQSQCRETGGA